MLTQGHKDQADGQFF